MSAGVAYGEDGVARGAMGVDWAITTAPDVRICWWAISPTRCWGFITMRATGLFVDEAPLVQCGARKPAVAVVRRILLRLRPRRAIRISSTANGHIEEEIGRVQPKIKYAEPPLLFRNLGSKKFANVSNAVGADFTKPLVARGAIYGDFDHDGDLDVLLTSNNGPAHLYRNDGGNRNKWISIRTVGTKSNRDGIGASVSIASASGKQWNVVRSGSSYASQSDLALVFGLGQDPVVNSIEVTWPSGTKQKFTGIPADQFLTIDESRGILK